MTTREKEYLILYLVFMVCWSGTESGYCGSKSCDKGRKTFQYAGNLRAQCSSFRYAVGSNFACTANEDAAAISDIKLITYGSGANNLPSRIVCQGPDPYFSRCSRVSGKNCHWRTPLVCREIDVTRPTAKCPANLILNASHENNTKAVAMWTLNLCSDNSKGNFSSNCTHQPGAYFGLGKTKVDCDCTDRSGNTGQCSFFVIIKDVTRPTANCPTLQPHHANKKRNTTAIVTWNQTICSDNSQIENFVGNCSNQPEDEFPIGNTTVNCNCTDSSGNTNQCSFVVTVKGESYSTVVCPSNQSLSVSVNETTAAPVEWNDISCKNNAGDNIQPKCTTQSGSLFNLGEKTVTCICKDNRESAELQCSFVIKVTVVMYPKVHEKLKTKNFYELESEKSFSLNCTADHAEDFWWKQETFRGIKIVSNSSKLLITPVSFRDQGSYFCIVKGKKMGDYVKSEAQVLVVKDYLQFSVKLFTNNNFSNNVTREINMTLTNESFEVIQNETSEEGVLQLYIFKRTTHETQPSSIYEEIKTKLNHLRDNLKTWDYKVLKTAYCTGEQITTTDGTLRFPDALVGKSVESYEISLTSRITSRATRSCDGNFIDKATWKEPDITIVTMDLEENITRSIENLAMNLNEQPVVSSNASYVADVLENVTASAEVETEHLETIATALSRVVEAQNVSEKVTTSVVFIVDNVVKSTSSNNTTVSLYSNTSASLLETLQQQLDNVRDSGLSFNLTTPNIAVRIIHVIYVNELVIYKTIFANDDEERRERNVTETISNDEIKYASKETGVTGDLNDNVKVSIQVDSAAVTKSARQETNGTESEPLPISFLIHRSSALFSGRHDDNMKVNTLIVSASVQGTVKELPDESNIITHFYPIQERRCAKISCVYWDEHYEGTGGWSRNGCRSTESEHRGSPYTCHCNHLTNFAVLLDVEGDINSRFLDYVSIIGCVVSTWCLILTICTYVGIKKLRSSRPQQIVLNLCFALLGLYLSFLAGIEQVHLEIGCIIFGALIHFFTLASVTWMSVEATNMYLLFVKIFPANIRHFFIKASLVGWGIPGVIVVISAVVSPDSYSNCKYCFPDSNSMIFYISVLSVVGLLITYNFIIFILVTYKLTCGRTTVTKANLSKQETFRRLQNVVAISILLGVTWIFGLLSFGEIRGASNFLFCALNSFQGLCIFVLFCVRQKEIRHAWKTWLQLSVGRADQTGLMSSTKAEKLSKRQLINEAESTSAMRTNSKVELSNMKSDISEARDENPYNFYSEVRGTNYDEIEVTNYACYADVDPKNRNLPSLPEEGHYTKEISSTIDQREEYRTTSATPELYMEIPEDRGFVNGRRNGCQPSAEEETDMMEYADIPFNKSAYDWVDFTASNLVHKAKIQPN